MRTELSKDPLQHPETRPRCIASRAHMHATMVGAFGCKIQRLWVTVLRPLGHPLMTSTSWRPRRSSRLAPRKRSVRPDGAFELDISMQRKTDTNTENDSPGITGPP